MSYTKTAYLSLKNEILSIDDDFLDSQVLDNPWLRVYLDILEARGVLPNHVFTLTVHQGIPKKGSFSFYHKEISNYDRLNKYCGEYGFVVPVKRGRSLKVLKGEKLSQYNKKILD